MDYDGYERRPPQPPLPLSREDEERIAAQRRYEDGQRREWEERHLAYLKNSPMFAAMVAGQNPYRDFSEQEKDAIAAAAAKAMVEKNFTNHNIDPKQMAGVVHDAVAQFWERLDQERARQQAAAVPPQPEQRIERDIPTPAGPTGQWLGKYAELERLSERGTRDDPGEEIARRQRDENDKRQSLTPHARSDERKPTEHEHKEASRERTERRLERSASTKEVTERVMERRAALMEKFGDALDEALREAPEHDRGRSRER